MYDAQLTYERIDKIAKLRGISISKINEICSLSKNAISNAAKSEFGMKAKNIVSISEILDVSTDYLLGRTDNPQIAGDIHISSDNGSVSNIGNNANITVSGNNDVDEMTTELVKAFRKLNFADKMEIMNLVLKKTNK